MSLPPRLHPLVPQSGSEAELLPRLEALLASAPLGIVFLDRELRVERVNVAALATVLGRRSRTAADCSVDELAPALAEFSAAGARAGPGAGRRDVGFRVLG